MKGNRPTILGETMTALFNELKDPNFALPMLWVVLHIIAYGVIGGS